MVMVAPVYSLPGAFSSIIANSCSHPTKYKVKEAESEALRNEGTSLEPEYCYV